MASDIQELMATTANVERLTATTAEELWSDVQAAAYLRLAPGTLRKARMVGSGPPYIQLGAAIRYSPPEVRKWALQHTRISTAAPRGTMLTVSSKPAAKPGPGSRPRGRPRKARQDTAGADGEA
jgi:hypothetical protein